MRDQRSSYAEASIGAGADDMNESDAARGFWAELLVGVSECDAARIIEGLECLRAALIPPGASSRRAVRGSEVGSVTVSNRRARTSTA